MSGPPVAVNLPATIQPKPLDLPKLDKATKEGALKSLPVRTFFRVWEAYLKGQEPEEEVSDEGNFVWSGGLDLPTTV